MKKALLICGLIGHFIGFGQKPKLVLPIGHTSGINSAKFSPDGTKVVTSSSDNTAKIWDTETGKLLSDLSKHSATVVMVNFSPDGKKIVSASNDSLAIIWDTNTGHLITRLIGHNDVVNSAYFSPDGKKVVTASEDKTAKVWDAQTGKLLFTLVGHNQSVNSAKFNSIGNKIVTASDDKTGKIWNAENGQLLSELKGHSSGFNTAEFSTDGIKIVTCSDDSTAKIWDAETGILIQNLIGHNNSILSAIFSSDNKKIATSSHERYSKIWNVETGELIANLDLGDVFNICPIHFSPDSKKVVTASYNNAMVWDAETGLLLTNLLGHTSSINYADFSPDGKKIVTASDDYTSKIFTTETGKLITELRGHSKGFTSASFSKDGKKIMTVAGFNFVNFWDAETSELTKSLSKQSNFIQTSNFSPNGKYIVTASYDNFGRIFDVETGKLKLYLNGHTDFLTSANFSPDSKKIITSSEDNTAKIWDAETGKLIFDLKGHDDWVFSANFSPDGKKVVTACHNGHLKIWDSETGEFVAKFIENGYPIIEANFSPDGKYIVTASADKTSKIWDIETKLPLYLIGHTSKVFSADFSPDGNKVITASWDNTAKIWDAKTGQLLINLIGHTSKVNSANYSPDGKKVITASDDNTAKIWDAETGKLFYTFIAIDSTDYLVIDNEGRFDGTEAARKMLYYVCGTEIIDLDQIKDLCWEPGLVEKIMGTNKEPIKAKRLDEISICGNSPIIENIEEDKDQKKFKIKRRGGGIGELAIYINQKEVEKIPVSSLNFINDEVKLIIDAEKFKNYFQDGKENSIQLQARTADLSISTKGAVMQVKTNSKPTTAPNLYAIIAGVSDYKGDKLDLRFAAKDAEDFSNALQESARALLNIDGKEHVFITTLVSNSPNSPSKSNISKAFADIKNKAKANDIVVVYLSGHGENFGTESTNFYYLTEDASSFELSGIEKEVAISTNEFAEWLKAIAAGKQVLILDACASGKLAEDMLIAMRAGISSDQIRALDRLNSRTGTFILSGAAANQSAYETSIYGQGLLTYSLLYGMKSGTALKDNQFVDVDKLFQYCADKVKELAAGIGGIQDPVISKPNGGASFDIGKIDKTVASKIVLALPKPIFTNSKFYNKETDDDNLGLEKAIDNLLNEYASKGKESKLIFTEKSQLPESYKLVGSYQLINNVAEITIRLKKGSAEIQKFEVKGDSQNIEKLALDIIEKMKIYLN